jgi:hypothetical protein
LSLINAERRSLFFSFLICNVSQALPLGKCGGLPRLLAKESLHRV